MRGEQMDTQNAVSRRIKQLCNEKGFTINGISVFSAVSQSTVNHIIAGDTKNPGIVTIKKLCDGFGITLGEFFSTPEFDGLEQEIK